MQDWKVYCHTNKVNDKKYVGITGQDIKERWRNGNGYKSGHLKNAIGKYGWNNFKHEVLHKNVTKEEAEKLEIYYIALWHLTDEDKGYNLCIGGNTTVGYNHTEESKEKMSQSHIGLSKGINNPMYNKHHTEEIKTKISERNKEFYNNKEHHPLTGRYGENNPNYGKRRTEEQREKISRALTGRAFSKEHINNISKAQKGKIISDKQKQIVSEKLKNGNNGRAINMKLILNEEIFHFDTKKETLEFLQEKGITTNTNNHHKGEIIKKGMFKNIINKNLDYIDTNNNKIKICVV